ncbi:MAG TPA: hypothetical protein VGV59_05755 [Pyrinomonadaceae bacterium]|nr:hypothetical protein [Pyrinomonadaceae bacterium]
MLRNVGFFLPGGMLSQQKTRPPTAKNATPEQQSRFDEAYLLMLELLGKNGGDNPCAKLFGGYDKAVKALNESSFEFIARDPPLTPQLFNIIHGATENRTIYINSRGGFMAQDGLVPTLRSTLPNSAWPNEKAHVTIAFLPGTHAQFRTDVKFAAFVLLHELGHRRNIYGKDNKDGFDDKNGTAADKTARNNLKVIDACFSSS